MIMPGRKYQAGNGSYGYSINGQMKDKELNENITSATYWEYDSRIGRRWNVDPVNKLSESPYLTFGGNPIWLTDFNGADTSKGKLFSSKEFAAELQKQGDEILKSHQQNALIYNKKINNEPLINSTAAVTLGFDFSIKGKILGVGAGFNFSQESMDLTGWRDNQGMNLGTNEETGEKTRRTGFGFNYGGYGIEIMAERDANKTSLNPQKQDEKGGVMKMTTKVSAPLNNWQETQVLKEGGMPQYKPKYSHATPIVEFKAAALIGVDFSVEVNTRNSIILVSPPKIGFAGSDQTFMSKPKEIIRKKPK